MTPNTGDLPSFSIIIPTYNRPAQLPLCLSALTKLDYPRNLLEIIVVDDGGTVNLSPIIDQFRAQANIKLLNQANAGPAVARNTGAAAAAHDYLAFTDDDCEAAPDWLKRMASALLADREVLVGGSCVNALRDNAYAEASQAIIDVVHSHFNHDHQNAVFFPSSNIALSKRAYAESGGFDPAFRCAEDRDFCDRWRARGRRLVFEPDARIDHSHQMGFAGFVKQHVGYGRGAWLFHRARKIRQSGKLKVEGSFYMKCFAQPLKTQPFSRAVPVIALLGVWQVANMWGFVCEAIKLARQPRPAAASARN